MRYRVVCDNQVPVDQPKTHAHIVEVGTGTTPQHYDRLWSVAEVIAANGRGDVSTHSVHLRGKRRGSSS